MALGTGVAELAQQRDLSLVIATGTEYWRRGRIALTLHGDGAVDVEHWRSGEHATYSQTLDHEELQRVSRELAELEIEGLSSSRTHFARGEETITIELKRADEILHHAELPAGDRNENERLDALMGVYERLVERVTAGELPYGPAGAER
jgi:hypothetical protein